MVFHMNRRKSERTHVDSIVDSVDDHVRCRHPHHRHQSSFVSVEGKMNEL
jgi:hypothetical protein